MATQTRTTSTILRWLEQMDEYPDEQLKTKDLLLWKFDKFMSDVDFSFNVFETEQLNKELKDKFYKIFLFKYMELQVNKEPEYLWRIVFERIYLENIDRFNKKLKVQLIELENIEDKLYQNYDLKSVFTENVKANEKLNKKENDKGTQDETRNQDKTYHSDKKETDNENKDTTNRDFTREIYEDTPNGQLNLTTNDGSGVITTATTINESLETQEGTEKTDKNKSTITDDTQNIKEQNKLNTTDEKLVDTLKDKTQDKDNERIITGYQNLGSKSKLLDDYQNLFSNTLQQFVNTFDKLFSHIY